VPVAAWLAPTLFIPGLPRPVTAFKWPGCTIERGACRGNNFQYRTRRRGSLPHHGERLCRTTNEHWGGNVEQTAQGEKLQVDTVDKIIDLDRQEILSILRDVQEYSVPAEYSVDRDAPYIERRI
jgi:hypothetical protein